MTDLVISIVNHNNRRLLGPFLSSILAETRHLSFMIYVVDNASRDGSAAMVAEMFPQVTLIRNANPQGFAANHNQVLRRAKGRYYVLLNDDMLLIDNAFHQMVRFMDVHAEVGAVGCKLLKQDGTTQRSAWVGFPSPRALFIDLFYLSRLFPGLGSIRKSEVVIRDSTHPIEVDHLSGACLLVRQQVLQQVGLLDESFFMYLEETDWCYRIRRHGWKIYWMPKAKMLHYGQQSVGGDLRRFIPMRYHNYCKFCRKHGTSHAQVILLKFIIALGASMRAALWALRGLEGHSDAYPMMHGYLQVLREVSSF